MKTLSYTKTQTERDSHVLLIGVVANPAGSVVTIGPFSNEHELETEINRSGYPPDNVEPYTLLVPYPEGAKKPKVTKNESTSKKN